MATADPRLTEPSGTPELCRPEDSVRRTLASVRLGRARLSRRPATKKAESALQTALHIARRDSERSGPRPKDRFQAPATTPARRTTAEARHRTRERCDTRS